jgi:acyl-CoA dehydrogenase
LFFWIVLFVTLSLACAYLRVSLWVWTVATAIFLSGITKWFFLSTPWLILLWLIFFAIVVPFNLPFLRRKLFTDHLFNLYRTMMPTMSSTEKEALEAGTVWWDGELFSGKPNWSKLLSMSQPKLSDEEKAFINGPVEELCHMLNDWQITEELHDLPEKVWDFIKDKGFFGMIIPKEYGGLAFSPFAHSSVVMKIASRSTSAAVTVMVPNSLGPAELLLRYGTEEQKKNYLPRLARGEEIPCFALTGPEAGSDAASIPDVGIVCRGSYKRQKNVLGIRLNWEKRYITLGPKATLLGLAFKLFDPEHLLGDKVERGITLALIPTNTPGITIGNRHFPLNATFQVGPNWGKDVFIPIDWIIGGPDRAGDGWRMLMDCLAEGRSISLPALSAGSSKLASRVIGSYSRIRKQFKMPIGRFEGVEEALARIGGYTYIIDSARIMTAGAVNQGEKPSVISAIAKYHLTELARKVINNAMDIQGGAAICMGPRNLLARIYQSTPISITVEGANILTRNMIIFGQGAIRCHPFLQLEMKAVKDEDHEKGAREFDQSITGHIGFIISNAVRSLLLGLTGSRFALVPGSPLIKSYYRHLTRMSAAFTFVADITLLVLGSSLKRKERLSARLADVLSHLYLASATLKHFEDQGCPEEDLPFVHWACQYSIHAIHESLDGLLKNFPSRVVAACLRLIIFPFGKSYPQPDDDLGHNVAKLLFSPSHARERLTEGIYIPTTIEEQLGLLEDALKKVVAAEPAEKKIDLAIRNGVVKRSMNGQEMDEALKIKVISKKEASLISEAISAREKVVRVDDFPKDQWGKE